MKVSRQSNMIKNIFRCFYNYKTQGLILC
uniref:Uncharacterized protein n=1 Tax=Triatoma infestans TaxID=30076 RepID=A0A170U4S9_TRIIF